MMVSGMPTTTIPGVCSHSCSIVSASSETTQTHIMKFASRHSPHMYNYRTRTKVVIYFIQLLFGRYPALAIGRSESPGHLFGFGTVSPLNSANLIVLDSSAER